MTFIASRARSAVTVLVGLLAALFFVAGVVKLIPIDFERTNFLRFGYALWFMVLVGLVEIAGAILLLPRRTRFVGALTNAAVMVGAVASHLRAGNGLGMAAPALVLLVLLLVVAAASASRYRGAAALHLVRRSA